MTTGRIDKPTLRNPGGHIYKIDGEPAPGVTTILGAGIPKPALVYWAAKSCAEYAFDRKIDLDGLLRDEFVQIVKGAPWSQRDKAANLGTLVHSIADALNTGAEIETTDETAGYLEAYLRFTEQFAAKILRSEITIINRDPVYAGTLDLIADLGATGERWLIDIKTGKAAYPEHAIQLAAYADAECMLIDGTEFPMAPVDRLGVLMLRETGDFELVPVDPLARPMLRRTFRAAYGIWQFQQEQKSTPTLGDPL